MLPRRRVLLVTIDSLLVIALLTTDLLGNGSISVASAHALPASPLGSALSPARPKPAAMPFSTSAANSLTNLCQLFLIGLGSIACSTSTCSISYGSRERMHR